MLTLTTHPDGTRGFQLYVDGGLVGQLPSAFTGNSTEADGGDSIQLTGPLSLCNRADGDPGRSFNGYLTQLTIVDAALEPKNIKALYDVVAGEDGMAVGTAAVPLNFPYPDASKSSLNGTQRMQDQQLSKFRVTRPTLYDTTTLSSPNMLEARATEQEIQVAGSDVAPSAVAYDVPEGAYCTLDHALPAGLAFCTPGLVCIPQRQGTRGGSPASAAYPPGVCTKPVPGALLPEAFPPKVPAPLAYFPLSAPTFASYPDGSYQAIKISNADLVGDTRFGQVLQCNRANSPSFVQLDSVPYSLNGSFAINLFVKVQQESLHSSLFSYLYSHTDGEETDISAGPNKVHLFIPGKRSAFYGVSLRAILRDRVDKNLGRPSQVWIDTSGDIGNDQQGGLLEDGVVVDDGEWHMVTLSTLPSQLVGPKGGTYPGQPSTPATSAGHALYLDGILRAVLRPGVKRSTANGTDAAVQITGGAPATLTSSITLCGRSDLSPERFFSGQLSNLMLFDTALNEEQVAQLHAAYSRQSILFPAGDISSATNQSSTAGSCAIPFALGGHLHYRPVYMQGMLSCPTKGNNSWSSVKPSFLPEKDLNLTAYGVADGASLGPIPQALPRVTTSGQVCMLPFKHSDGNTYADCLQDGGTEKCQVAGGFMQECAPIIRLNVNTTSCVSPAIRQARKISGRMNSLKMFTKCVSIKGQESCQTESQSWIQCPALAVQRLTITGMPCRFPFDYNGMVHSDCIIDATQQFAEVCPVADESGSMLECQPAYVPPPSLAPRITTRFTLDRQECLLPGPGALSECLELDSNVPKCETASGALMPCAPIFRVGISGAPCQFPMTFNGRNRTNCVFVDGVEGCKTVEGNWEACASLYATSFPKPPANATGRFTVSGKSCAAPFEYRGKPAWDCVRSSGRLEYCTTVDGKWEQCTARVSNMSRSTAQGDQCVLPFEFGGVKYYDCLGADPATANPGLCMNRAGRLTLCRARMGRFTTTGKPCRFPQRWAGMSVNDCVIGPLSQKVPACPVSSGQWEACAPLYTQPLSKPNSTASSSGSESSALRSGSQPQAPADADFSSSGSRSGGDGGSDKDFDSSNAHSKKNKQRDLILGLVLGLGGGILVLAILLGALRREWAKQYRARVLKELHMSPSSGTAGASLELNARPYGPHSPEFPPGPLPTSKKALSVAAGGATALPPDQQPEDEQAKLQNVDISSDSVSQVHSPPTHMSPLRPPPPIPSRRV